MPATHLLYLHGFRSSPRSTKAQLVQERIAQRHPGVTLWCPQLPPSPREAMDRVMQGIANWPRRRMAVIGSSLGGFYASWVAEQTGCRAAVLNPAVFAARDLATQVGVHPSWHEPQESFEFKAAYVDELRALAVPAITNPDRYYALIAKGDEVLDWREMSAHYRGAHMRLLEGSNHAITEFADHLDEVLAFLDLAS
ncbi:YqiA/YcfP family alpha/beta fold hydrolase [Curvibacter sp. PAE-UM]|uniref:YqiA/YcfP family alpha/beta fold hydrolase n=1 Tax=Curvibacter sp. PAE-UM TaxID=1714344 RepID=UPI00070F145F|nr:YqiA/YcfP family alpha/beta fold hydrolase [Curvibacter sp. PAE-UM]KRI01672.1 esterase [Curvibacter sp. PAE-UM]